MYATVSGSALAMATNAAAGSVVYRGIQDVSTTPPLATENYPGSDKTAAVKLAGRQNVGSFLSVTSKGGLAPEVVNNQSGWKASHTAFAGFSFTNGGQANYGWVRLEYFEGVDHLANEIEAVDWAYTNGRITTPTGAPEPSTFALALLAAGAALRKGRSSIQDCAEKASL